MAIPNLLINTFVKQNDKTVIDPLSKIFIITEFALGLNRFPILGVKRMMYIILLFLYAAAANTFVVWYNLQVQFNNYVSVLMVIKYIQYVSCSVFSLLTWRRIRDFYCGLEKFDIEVGCRPKVVWQSLKICSQVAAVTFFSVTVFLFHTSVVSVAPALPVHMINILENHFYAHMLSLLTTRMRMLNKRLESSLKSASNRVQTNGKINMKMERLVDIYCIVIEAHTKLIDGIKWQLLLIITSSFVFVLGLCYQIAVTLIRESVSVQYTLIKSTVTVVEFIPLFAPCLCSDQLKAEVQRLKQLLAAKLYEGNISKPCRSSARTLLALTETRDLSFPLLRMVDISISLPFKFTGLLVTYLIILLQFEKVFNPPNPKNH